MNTSTSFLFVQGSDNGSYSSLRYNYAQQFAPPFLPLISPVSSFQFDIAFQSFSISPQPSPPSEPLLPKRDNLDFFEIPAFNHPNSPYVPWSDCNRPISPVSNISRYSRPYSRTGARAPEPAELLHNQSVPAILRLSQSLKVLRRTMKINVFRAAHRIKSSFSNHHHKVEVEDTCIVPIPVLPPHSPTMSFESANTTSLAAWLSARQRQVAEEYDPNILMTLDEYERAGSWLNVSDGGCGLAGCEMHSGPSDSEGDDEMTTSESSILRLLEPNTPSSLASLRDSISSLIIPGSWA